MVPRSGSSQPSTGTIPGYNEFELDIEVVLRTQIPNYFDVVVAAPLTKEHVLALPQSAKGAYVLLHKRIPVYAGKTDSRHGFQSRLLRHYHTLQHRKKLRIDDMSFKAVRILVFSNFDVETILIEEMRRRDPKHLLWNDSGFGSNDPGHNREDQEPAQFDKDFPIDIDRPLDEIQAGSHNLGELLAQVKINLPYVLRYSKGNTNQWSADLEVPHDAPTMRDLLNLVVGSLPGWQVTVFPNRVILYRERKVYTFATERFSSK